MSEQIAKKKQSAKSKSKPKPKTKAKAQPPKVVVCIDSSPSSSKVIPHAQTIAGALGREVMLVHVVEPQKSAQAPFDPVEWDISLREARLHVARLAKQFETTEHTITPKVVDGRFAGKNDAGVLNSPQDITALCRRADEKWHWQIDETARHVADSVPGSILMVPDTVSKTRTVRYSRVLVPLDGSSRAEGAIAAAVRIAEAQAAELVLVHATPPVNLTETGPLESEDIELKDRLCRRNERVAREYLERIRAQIADTGLRVHMKILKGGDVRRLLIDAVGVESADLLVLASHGRSGHADVPSGDVASFVLARSGAPVLMMRRPCEPGNGHVFSGVESKGIRRPLGAHR